MFILFPKTTITVHTYVYIPGTHIIVMFLIWYLFDQHTLSSIVALLEHGTGLLIDIRDQMVHHILALLIKLVQSQQHHLK